MMTIKMTIRAGTSAEGITMYICVITLILPTVVLYVAAVNQSHRHNYLLLYAHGQSRAKILSTLWNYLMPSITFEFPRGKQLVAITACELTAASLLQPDYVVYQH